MDKDTHGQMMQTRPRHISLSTFSPDVREWKVNYHQCTKLEKAVLYLKQSRQNILQEGKKQTAIAYQLTQKVKTLEQLTILA